MLLDCHDMGPTCHHMKMLALYDRKELINMCNVVYAARHCPESCGKYCQASCETFRDVPGRLYIYTFRKMVDTILFYVMPFLNYCELFYQIMLIPIHYTVNL